MICNRAFLGNESYSKKRESILEAYPQQVLF